MKLRLQASRLKAGHWAMWAAQAMASSRSVSSGTTLLMAPRERASWAVMGRPSRIISRALVGPMSRARRVQPPAPGGMPMATSDWP